MKKRDYQVGLELTDKQWKQLEPLLPEPPPSKKGGQIPASNRACLEGILWILRSGARYKDVPKHFPSGSTCWRRLKWWYEQGTLLDAWQTILGLLDKKGRLNGEECIADATFASALYWLPCKAREAVKPSAKPKKEKVRKEWLSVTAMAFRWRLCWRRHRLTRSN